MRLINNKKFIIAFLSVLLLSIVCFSGISLMFADEENGAFEGEEVKVLKAADSTNDFKTMIDHIIDNSWDPDSSDQVYHVLEIHSGDNPSKLQEIVEDTNKKIFEDLVINGHKTAAQTRNLNTPDYIEYTHYKFDYDLANDPDQQTLVTAIARADLIYLSEDPDNLWDRASNVDISNKVKEALATFATGQYPKPLIIDSHNLTQKSNVSSLKYIKDVASQYYAVEGSSYNTFPWPHDKDIEGFMNPANTTSHYKPIDGDAQKAGDPNYPDFGWNKVTYTEVLSTSATSTDPSKDHEEYIARVLTIHNSAISAGDSFLTDQLKACCDGDYSFTYTDAENTTKNKTVTAKGTFTPDGEIKILKEDSDLYKYGYYGRLARPDAIKFESIDLNNDTDMTALATLDFTQYDFVIFEATTKDVDVSVKTNLISNLVNAMRTSVHILYDSTIAPNGSGNNGQNVSSLNAPGVEYVYNKVANINDTPKLDSVLVTTRKNMEIFAGATTPDSVKPIADIINAGCFRTYIGYSSGDSSNMYTVLEIEPCYPIDTTLAVAMNPAKTLTYGQKIGRAHV